MAERNITQYCGSCNSYQHFNYTGHSHGEFPIPMYECNGCGAEQKDHREGEDEQRESTGLSIADRAQDAGEC